MQWKIKSNTVGNVYYTVDNMDDIWSCDCPAGVMNKMCIHIKKARHIAQYGSEMTVNENLVQLVRGKQGVASIEVPLLIGEEVELKVHGTVVGIEEEDNYDGTYNRVAKVKPTLFEKTDA